MLCATVGHAFMGIPAKCWKCGSCAKSAASTLTFAFGSTLQHDGE